MLNYFLLFLLTILTFTFLKPILILCQGDLFLYGSETMICPIKRKGSWVGCLGWQRGRVRTFFLFNHFPLFQIKVEPLNSYFSIIQRKKGTIKNQWQSLINSRVGILGRSRFFTRIGRCVEPVLSLQFSSCLQRIASSGLGIRISPWSWGRVMLGSPGEFRSSLFALTLSGVHTTTTLPW